jgi:hypothetical protein
VTDLLPVDGRTVPAVDAPALSVAEVVRGTPGVRSVVIGVSKDPNAKVTVLLVSERDGMPVMAVKVPTTPIAAAAVESETAALVELHARYSGVAIRTIPRVVRMVEVDGLRGGRDDGGTGDADDPWVRVSAPLAARADGGAPERRIGMARVPPLRHRRGVRSDRHGHGGEVGARDAVRG